MDQIPEQNIQPVVPEEPVNGNAVVPDSSIYFAPEKERKIFYFIPFILIALFFCIALLGLGACWNGRSLLCDILGSITFGFYILIPSSFYIMYKKARRHGNKIAKAVSIIFGSVVLLYVAMRLVQIILVLISGDTINNVPIPIPNVPY